MTRYLRSIATTVVAGALVAAALTAGGAQAAPPAQEVGEIKLVGSNALMNRGMNSALALHGDYAYVGSRTDGLHPNAGVMIVDVSDPTTPTVTGQIGMPNEANEGETSRELRVWEDEEILIVLNLRSNCSAIIHNCSPTQLQGSDNYRFYDISGDKAAAPELLAEYEPSANPHEFFLWQDPKDPKRALLYQSTPGGGGTHLLVADISNVRKGEVEEIAEWAIVIPEAGDNRHHSLSVSPDGNRLYMSYLQGGFFIADSSQVAKNKPKPGFRLLTPVGNQPKWAGPGAHSSVKLPGRDYALVTDEVYGEIPGLTSGHGCPWGWTRIIDIKNVAKPKVVSEYKLAQNDPAYCESQTDNHPVRHTFSSWAAHNPTLTKNLAFITWHSGGLQAISLADPKKPYQVAEFSPTPLPAVVTEDPVLSSGVDKVVMWSYPIIKDGLIYVTDVRNGLFILEYTGPFESEVDKIDFLEGNSNLGDAARLHR